MQLFLLFPQGSKYTKNAYKDFTLDQDVYRLPLEYFFLSEVL